MVVYTFPSFTENESAYEIRDYHIKNFGINRVEEDKITFIFKKESGNRGFYCIDDEDYLIVEIEDENKNLIFRTSIKLSSIFYSLTETNFNLLREIFNRHNYFPSRLRKIFSVIPSIFDVKKRSVFRRERNLNFSLRGIFIFEIMLHLDGLFYISTSRFLGNYCEQCTYSVEESVFLVRERLTSFYQKLLFEEEKLILSTLLLISSKNKGDENLPQLLLRAVIREHTLLLIRRLH